MRLRPRETGTGRARGYGWGGRPVFFLNAPGAHFVPGAERNVASGARAGKAGKAARSGSPPRSLVDTGAMESCIDSGLAMRLNLPIVDRRKISGVHGASAGWGSLLAGTATIP